MPEVPECLNRRYQVLDQLVRDLKDQMSSQNSLTEQQSNSSDVGIKLMCDFWNILKENPGCNLTREVQNRMGISLGIGSTRSAFNTQRYMTYMTNKNNDRRKVHLNSPCCGGSKAGSKFPSQNVSQNASFDVMPLSKALCNLKEAAMVDKNCLTKIKELTETQSELMNQIKTLEEREKGQVQKLKQADCMWQCMEEDYKKKLQNSSEKQRAILKELKELEVNAYKWKKNRKDIEFQIQNMNKLKIETIEKISQKKNDLKILEIEITNLEKRIEANKNDKEGIKKAMNTKKDASNARMVKIAENIAKVQKLTQAERTYKKKKEEEGIQFVKTARDDLQQLCKVLLQKKLENEDLRAEKAALLDEVRLLEMNFSTCKDRCKSKEQSIDDETQKLLNEIDTFQVKCIKCHVCIDTNDARRLCTDCPRCLSERDCLLDNDSCKRDSTMDCVCSSVKHKFLDNVFDNMYTVLERESKTNPGKAVADAVLNSLKRSRNGKLSQDTRQILQNFVLTTVKKNLNLTIVGGAVKTRCEMDPDIYKQLMLCLKEVKIVKPEKDDKGTSARKEPCARWRGTNECNCPKGPKYCICTTKAPPPPNDPKPCPQDKEDIGPTKECPYHAPKACGPDCGKQGKPPRDATPRDVAAWRPDPCSGQSCPHYKNMRAAQCLLGDQPLRTISQRIPYNEDNIEKAIACSCNGSLIQLCSCHSDCKSQPRQRIIEEVIGGYNDLSIFEKNSGTVISDDSPSTSHRYENI